MTQTTQKLQSAEVDFATVANVVDLDVLVKNTHEGKGVFAARNFQKAEVVVIGKPVKFVPERTWLQDCHLFFPLIDRFRS
ncbi:MULTISPECIES: hypothetical protein [Okeania]|uniref:Uncharacterized protein n=1 Tax=Okeania hirsuta TaxID=1458930 RepID=A0A3N6Q3J9_9CYAN|nr:MULTISPECIES: hypothetical protein [Okeania]NEP05524.1 hypothetical protein [Okeania sp. SIO4D6]NEP37976.1 hypothetical protein [Okeania sp. SIO2H7]NET13236.1 hypothetical protein [Okeania sp. SIO1H6]NEP73294.1 hypothetical protein [Okeania sp. SIO2G5]NEP91682.1 hypothetical protein [Okeania sp. SIO2F5]